MMITRNIVQICFLPCLAILLFLQGCAGHRIEIDVSGVAPAAEATYARQLNPFVRQHLGSTVQNEDLQAYLGLVGRRLLGNDQPGWTFSVVNDPAVAAFALPGGEIIVTRGLFSQVESEAELLVVLAHLLGHDRARHGLQAALADSDGHLSAAGLVLPSAVGAAADAEDFLKYAYGAGQEIAADRYALEILASAGVEPDELMTRLTALEQRLERLPESQNASWLTRHPLTPERIKAATGAIQTLAVATREKNSSTTTTTFDALHADLLAVRPAYDLYQQAVQVEKQGSVDRAIDLYLQGAVAAPEETLILTGLGMAYMRQEALVAARQHLTRAARLDPDYYYPQLGLGYIYLQQQDLIQAAKRLRRSQTLLPTAQGAYLLARVFDEAADPQTALDAYRDIVRDYAGSRMATLAARRITELESLHELE